MARNLQVPPLNSAELDIVAAGAGPRAWGLMTWVGRAGNFELRSYLIGCIEESRFDQDIRSRFGSSQSSVDVLKNDVEWYILST